MSRKHVSNLFTVSDQADMSAQIISPSTVVEQFDFVSYFFSWVGVGSTGEIFVEVSSEKDEKDALWKVLDFGTGLPIGVDAGDDQILIKDVHFKRIRLRYEPTAGTGTMDIKIKSGTKGA